MNLLIFQKSLSKKHLLGGETLNLIQMSTIDLSKLIARKTFFIPNKSSVVSGVLLKQILLRDPTWTIAVERPRSGEVRWNYPERWARTSLLEKGLHWTDSNLDKQRAEYGKSPIERIVELFRKVIYNVPCEVHYVITEETKEGCICQTTCIPALYEKITRRIEIACDDARSQDARLRCEEFLVDIFVGGLGGKEIVERREVTRWELLINDIDCRHITERVYQMLEQAVGEVSIMGWVGTGCLPKLKELRSKGVTIQAVTHKPSELKSPVPKDIQQGYTNLVKILGKMNVSTNRQLHGRAIVVDNKALIGSMDMNAHSLSGEHKEFAVYTEDADTVRKLRTYFREIFVPLS